MLWLWFGVGLSDLLLWLLLVVVEGGGAFVASNLISNRNSQTLHPNHNDSNRGSSGMLWLSFRIGILDLLLCSALKI